DTAPVIVTTEAELYDWCQSHLYTGGTVTLGCNIVITQYLTAYNTAPITIDTGGYGLVYNGGSLGLIDFEIIGEGINEPVLTVVDTGAFRLSWIHHIHILKITATGDGNGAGGTAMLIKGGNDWPPNADYFAIEGLIQSFGAGAVGVELAVPIDIYCLNVKVEGENSVAIRAMSGANLYYCKLNAQGTGASAVGGRSILLDTCAVSPAPAEDNITIVERRVIGASNMSLYLPVVLNDDMFRSRILLYGQVSLLLDSGSDVKQVAFRAEWDEDIYFGIDTGTVGITPVPGSLLKPFIELGLTDDYPLELIVDVRDQSVPCISSISVSDAGPVKSVMFMFWKSDAWGLDDLILWRSDDKGETWYDTTISEDIDWLQLVIHDRFIFEFEEISDQVWFQLESPGFGMSNIVTLYSVNGKILSGSGGDRTGTDSMGGGDNEFTDPNIEGGSSYPGDNGNANTGDGGSNNNNSGTDAGDRDIESGNGNTNSGDGNIGPVAEPVIYTHMTDANNSREAGDNAIITNTGTGMSGADTMVIAMLPANVPETKENPQPYLAPREEIADVTIDADEPPPLAAMPIEPLAPVEKANTALYIAIAVAFVCLGALAWLASRRFFKTKS
ncbi:MAG: hypothetical protein LBH28_10475, partial [Oscillospiraceae bacterium]|nr:hypothetical protein [Oscillospiraceae bacterium]